MCQNVIKNVIARLPWDKKADFNIRLTSVRAKKRQILWVAQDGKCHYCERETVLPRQGVNSGGKSLATLDHIITQSDGGTDHLHNMVIACAACNSNRSNMPYEEFYYLMKTPGGWEAHMKIVRAEKAARDEEKRQANLKRHEEMNAMAQSAAKERQLVRLRNHAPFVIKMAKKNGIELPSDPEERIKWAIDYHLRQAQVAKEFGPEGKNLLASWINRANFAPRKNGKGGILVLDIHPGDYYHGREAMEELVSMELAA